MAFLKLDKLGARERWGLGLALVFVLVLMVDRLVVGMVAERVSAVEAQTAIDSKKLDLHHGVLRSKGPIEAVYTRIEGVLTSEMSDSEAIDVIKGEIDDLARETGVDLISMEHRSPEPSPGFTEYVIDIRKLEGSMEGLLSFLHRIWETPGMMRVRKVMIGPGAEDGRVEGTVVVSKILIPTGAASEGEEPPEEGETAQ